MEIEKLNTYLMVGLQCPWPVTWAVLSHLNGTPTQKTDCVEWRLNGKLHRIGGPAMEWANGSKWWWELDKLHRIGGPAVEWADGSKEWWERGIHVSPPPQNAKSPE